MKALASLVSLLAITGCGGSEDASPSPTEPFTVSVRGGGSVDLPGMSISLRFVSVSDDRCPVDVLCIRAGSARVVLAVAETGQAPASLVVGLPTLYPESAPTYRSSRYTLVSLTPTHSYSLPMALGLYEAVVRVEPI